MLGASYIGFEPFTDASRPLQKENLPRPKLVGWIRFCRFDWKDLVQYQASEGREILLWRDYCHRGEGQHTKAHKMILCACSPYFKNLLEQNPAKHPIIILKDVPFMHLTAILEFMYAGEVNVAQDQLPAFLKTAEKLKIKGLAEGEQEKGEGMS